MKKKYITIKWHILCVLLVFSNYCFAQKWKDQWKQATTNTARTFYQSLADAEQYFNENPSYIDTPQSGYKDYMRFYHFWKNKINADGTYTDYPEAIINYVNSSNASSHSSSNWTILGPTTRPSVHGDADETGMGWINALDVFQSQKNLMYAGSNSGGLYKSSNGGTTWSYIPFADISIGIQSICIDPNDSNTVYIATGTNIYEKSYGLGVFKTVNGGASWTKIYSDASNPYEVINAVSVDPSNSSIIFIAYRGKIFKSTNGGSSFSQKLEATYGGNNWDVKFTNIIFKPNDTDVIYASGRTLFKSTDGGENWNDITSNTSLGLGSFIKNSNYNFVSFTGGIASLNNWVVDGLWYASTNGSKTVAKIKPIPSQYKHITENNPDSTYYIPERIYNFKVSIKLPAHTSFRVRLLKSNLSDNEIVYNSGLAPATIDTVISFNFLYSQSNDWYSKVRVEVTADSNYNGTDWLEIDYVKIASLTADKISVATTPQYPDKLYLGISNFSFGGKAIIIDKSNNEGVSFSQVRRLDPIEHIDSKFHLAVSPTDTNRQYLGLAEKRKTTNGWINSNPMEDNGIVHADIRKMLIFNNNSEDLIYLANDGGVSVSQNSGATWLDKSNKLTVTQFYGIAGIENNPNKLIGGCQDLGTKIYLDKIWKKTSTGDGYGDPFIDPFNDSIMFSRDNDKLRRTTNNFLSSVEINDAKNATDFKAIVTNYSDQSYTLFAYNSNVIKSTSKGTPGSWLPISSNSVIGNSGISSISVCESNPNYIYFSEQFPGSGAKIWRTTSGGGLSNENWIDVTGVLPTLYAGITDIEVDPFNPNRVWVTFGSMSEGNKVFFRDFSQSGTNWINFSDGIDDSKYNLPVNCIKYWKGSNDGLFIGTDVGVFYRDNTMSEWVEYNNGFHPTIIQDLEINNLDHKIRAATFGRGLWESPLPECTYNSEEYILEGTDTINTYTKMNRNVVIEDNGLLVIKSRLIMSNDTKIIVKKGGKLVIDGGHVTNTCGGMWDGIIVEGSKIDAQSANTHGWCEVKNGGTIENARIAIRSLSGGVVRVIGGNFYNNRFGVSFNLYSLNNNGQHANLSVVANSKFICSKPMVDSNTYMDNGVREGSKSFVSIAQQDGIRVINNDFISTYRPRADLKGNGIVTWASRTYIHNNDFSGLTYGIEAAGFQNALQANSVYGNEFTDVSLAITETAQAGSQIRANTIVLPVYESNPWLMENYGIKEDVSRGFNLTKNSIESANSIQSNVNIYGVLVRNSQNLPCNVDHNIFEKLQFATQLEGDNKEIGIQCNTYNNSTQDWSINPVTIGDIKEFFGSNDPSLTQAANKFPENLSQYNHILLNESMTFTYFSVADPFECIPSRKTLNVTVTPIEGSNFDEECEMPFDPCGGNPVPCVAYAEDLVNNNTAASADLLFKYKLNLAQQLKDSGMIEELRQMIEAETTSEWEELKLPMYIEYGESMNVNPQDIIDNLPTGEYKDFMQLALDINNESLPIDSVGDIGLTEDIATLANGVTPMSNASKKILEIFFGYQFVREAERWEESNMVIQNNTNTTKALANEVEEHKNDYFEENSRSNQKTKPELTLLPNPSNGNFLIKLSSSASGLINIIDMHGKIIKEVYVSENGDLRIEKGILSPGVYTVRLVNIAQSYQLNKRMIILE